MIRTSFNFTVSAGDNIIEQCQRAFPEAGDNLRIHSVVVTSAQLAISTQPLEHCISVATPADGSVFERVVLGHGTPGTAAENTFLANIDTVTGAVVLDEAVISITGAVELVSTN